MGRLLWTLALCGVFIALATNVDGATYTTSTPAKPKGRLASFFDDVFKKLYTDIKLVYDVYKARALQDQTNEKELKKEFIKSLIEVLIINAKEDIKALSKCLFNEVDKYFKNIINTKVFGDIILYGITYVTAVKQGEYGKEVENITKNPKLYVDFLEAVNKYPEPNKESLIEIIKSELDNAIYNKYLELSDDVKDKLKFVIRELVNYIEKYVDGVDEYKKCDEEDFIAVESGILIDGEINNLINKIFKSINKRIKELLDDIL